jgi:uncharacterized RDD family membrane protein YckC
VIRACPSIARPAWPSLWWRLAAVLWLCPGLAVGQQRPEIRIAANEQCLWVVVVSGSQSRLFFREAGADFDLGRATNQPIADLVALDRDLLVFFEDGALYHYSPEAVSPTVEAVLPQRELPREMVGGGGRVYAIISSSGAAELPVEEAEGAEATSQAFDPGDSTYSVAVFDGRRWSALAALPAVPQASGETRLRPRLCLDQDKLLLFTPAEVPGQLHYFYFDREHRQWVSRGSIGSERLVDYWAVDFCRVPTLVMVTRKAAEPEKLAVFRLLGDPAQSDVTRSEPAELRFSDLPADVVITRYAGVVGFNQHLGLLALTAQGEAYVRFGRVDGPPTEPTVDVAQLLAEPGVLRRGSGVFQSLTFALLVGVLVGLFVFRRGSMVRVVELPPGCALALNVQRLGAWLIDFIPFTLAAAAAVGIPWGEGLSALGRWGISPNQGDGLPEQNVLLWWSLSVVGYTTYSLVMELITRRTVGKVIARVYLLSEAGTRPTAGQILARNLTRLIELMPQFWIFVVLVVFSRNRQRMGDIFARTVAIRYLSGKPSSTTSRDESEGEHKPNGTDAADGNGEERGSSGPDQK